MVITLAPPPPMAKGTHLTVSALDYMPSRISHLVVYIRKAHQSGAVTDFSDFDETESSLRGLRSRAKGARGNHPKNQGLTEARPTAGRHNSTPQPKHNQSVAGVLCVFLGTG